MRYRLIRIRAMLMPKVAIGSVNHPVSVETPNETNPMIPITSNILPAIWNWMGTKPAGLLIDTLLI
jgi:hypothetical protein